jgi:hypothetical protein
MYYSFRWINLLDPWPCPLASSTLQCFHFHDVGKSNLMEDWQHTFAEGKIAPESIPGMAEGATNYYPRHCGQG